MAFLYYHATLEEGQKWIDDMTREQFLSTCIVLARSMIKVQPLSLMRAEKNMVEKEIFKNRDPEALYSLDTMATLVTTPKGLRNENWGILTTIYNNGTNPQELRRILARAFQKSITNLVNTAGVGPIARFQAIAHLRIKPKWHVLPNKPEEYCFTAALGELREEYERSIPEGLEEAIVDDNLDEEDAGMQDVF